MTHPTNIDDAHHSDNQRRFIELENKIDANTALTTKLASDTSDLLEMWCDAGVFFKWMRRAGSFFAWLGKMALAFTALYGISKLFGGRQ